MAFLSYDQKFKVLHGGIGVNLRTDIQGGGGLVDAGADLIYAGHFNLGRNLRLQPAVQLGYAEKYFDPSRYFTGDNIDPYFGFVYTSTEDKEEVHKRYFDIGTGLVFYSKRMQGGFAAHHLNRPDVSLLTEPYHLQIKYTAHIGFTIGSMDSIPGDAGPSKHFLVTPGLLYLKQQDSQAIMLGVNLSYRAFSLGLHYRFGDAMIVSTGFRYKFFSIGYSYDHTTSNLGNMTVAGSHELSMIFCIKGEKKESAVGPVE